MAAAQNYLARPILLFALILLLPVPSISSQESTAALPPSVVPQEEVQENIVLHQLEVSSKLGSAKKNFDMEESGIIGLGDSTGLSLGLKYYLGLVEKYKKSLKEDSENIQLWLGLARTWETLKKDANALDAYQRALMLSENNSAAQKGIKRIQKSRQLQLRIYWSSLTEDEYSPFLQRDYISWTEQVKQVQVTKSWGTGKTIGFGWLESSIEQDNLLYGDLDFSLKRQAPFFLFSWPLADRISTSIRIRNERFSNDNKSAYYQLEEAEYIITGHALINYRGDGFWANINYSRNRETDPIYDQLNLRGALNVEVKELSGISGGIALAPGWEVGSSVYYEQYSSTSPDQFNANMQFSHLPSWFPGLQMSLGSGYYSEEEETIVNLSTKYQWQPWQQLQLQLEYQLEYSENENSWLNQGDILANWSITEQLSLSLRAQYGTELGDDNDTIFFTQASLNWNIF